MRFCKCCSSRIDENITLCPVCGGNAVTGEAPPKKTMPKFKPVSPDSPYGYGGHSSYDYGSASSSPVTNPGYRPPASSPVTNPGYRPPASSPVTNPGYRPPASSPVTNPGYRPPASSPVTNPGYRPPASSPVTNPGYRPPVSTPKTPSSYGSASFETDTKPSETELRDDAVSSQSLKAMPVSDSAPMYTTESAAQPEHDARVVSFENKDRCTEIDKNPPDSKYDDDETINFDTVTPTLTIPTSSDAENKKDVSCDDMPAYSSEISINDKPAKKKNKIVIVFLLIAIIALLGVGGYMAYNRFFKNTADTVENSEVQNLVNAYVTAVNKNDAKTMVDISVVGALSDEQVQQVYGMSYEEMVGETRIAADLIKGMSLSVTPVDVCEMSSEEIDTINIGAPDGIRISDGIEIVCDLNISGNGTSEIKRKTFSAVKLNDNWYLFNA